MSAPARKRTPRSHDELRITSANAPDVAASARALLPLITILLNQRRARDEKGSPLPPQ